MKKRIVMIGLLIIGGIIFMGISSNSLAAASAASFSHSAAQETTSTPTPLPRRATHTPEPELGVVETPEPVEKEEGSRTGYYISLAVLIALMILNMVLGRIAKKNRQK